MNWKKILSGIVCYGISLFFWYNGEIGGRAGAHYTMEENPIFMWFIILCGFYVGTYLIYSGWRGEE